MQPDARLVVSDTGQIATYTRATDRYTHGIMGDALEGGGLAVLEVANGAVNVVAEIELPENVFEGISPLWADIDSDGEQEIITTYSNPRDGAALRAYEANGNALANTTPIGQGGRWRHQVAVAPFGFNGETQLVDVRTPHIGGIVEFFDLVGDAIEIQNAQLGYTTHIIGSRNLDMGLAGDFDGNGIPELVGLDQIREIVLAVENTPQGVTEVWRLPLGGSISSNFAAITLPDGTAALAAGTRGGTLRIWQP
jgi:hypothetical protein